MRRPPANGESAIEAWLLDVGQGTANIIRLGHGRAIVIDCGPPDSHVPLAMLRQERISSIEALVVSHTHNDHDGGAARIIQAYSRQIKRIYFVQDGPAASLRSFDLAIHEYRAGRLRSEPLRLEARPDAYPIYPWPEDVSEAPPPPLGVRVHVLHPSFAQAVLAERDEATQHGRSNRQSGIVALGVGECRLIFPGDASIEAWEAVASSHRLPLRCDVFAGAHHGGHVTTQRRGETRDAFIARREAAIQRLYEIVDPRHVVFSVSSSNRFGSGPNPVRHPLPQSVAAACRAGATVICTQMTPQCCGDLEAVRPALVDRVSPSRSSMSARFTGAGTSKDVGCMGTVVVSVRSTSAQVFQLADHRQAVARLNDSEYGTPMCVAPA